MLHHHEEIRDVFDTAELRLTCCAWKHACLVVMLCTALHGTPPPSMFVEKEHKAGFIRGVHDGASSFAHVLIVLARMRKGCSLEKQG